MAGWEDAPIVESPSGAPKAAWERAPVTGGDNQPIRQEAAPPSSPDAAGPRRATLESASSAGPGAALQGMHDLEAAALQGVNPYATSKYFPSSPEMKPQLLGHIEEYDWGPGYRMGDAKDGAILRVNPQTDFIARNPDTGRLAVYSRTPQTDENRFVSASRLIAPNLAVGPVTSSIRAIPEAAQVAAQTLPHSSAAPPAIVAGARTPGMAGTAAGAQLAAQRAADAARDIESFERLGVRKPPIAFSEGPVAATGQMVSRIPYLGAPIHRSLTEAVAGAAEAARNISGEMAPAASAERAGQTLQQGLDRFRTAGVRELEPGVLSQQGIEARAPVQPRPFMSAGALERAQQAGPIREELGGGFAQTNRSVQVPAARPLDQTLMARRGAEDLSDAELARLIRAPAQDTSFAARSEALYEKAWRSVPSFMRIDESANPTRLAATNTRAALGQVDRAIANQIAGQGTISGDLAARIRNPSAHFSLDDLRAVRTEVGRALSNFSPYQATLDRGQLRSLYAALSRDIEIGLQDIANRAYLRTRVSNNRPDYVAPEVALRADQALRDFRTADRYFRQGIDRMDRFAKVAGMDNPQAAAGMLMRSALDGTKGNMGMLRSAMAALRPEERRQFSALMLDEMGKPTPSARGIVEQVGFSPTSFMTRWNRLDPGAKELLFGGEFRQAMDDLTRVASRLSNQEALANTSRSGTDIINFLMMAGGGALFMSKQFGALAALAGPTAAFSFLMSRPAYVRWIAQYARLRAATLRAPVSDAAPRALVLVNQLHRMALKDPSLLPAYRAVAAEHGIGESREEKKSVEGQPRLH